MRRAWLRLGVISIDGMKIRANASRGANRTYEKLVADRFGATRGWDRQAWQREAHKELLRRREQAAQPIGRGRAAIVGGVYRLEENQQVEIQASEQYDAWKAKRIAAGGHRVGGPAKPYMSPAVPEGVMNKTDPDSRMMRTQGQPTVQGYCLIGFGPGSPIP
jgi:hypothetical protein